MNERPGVVVIGRNEGERLRTCLASLAAQATRQVVYVDSGSTDGSVQLARDMGALVAELDRTLPFTAARARNAGFARLLQAVPDLQSVQFVDGDCEVVAGWLSRAENELSNDSSLAVVCGRRRERFRERSIYNRLCDLEWDTPIGPANACGGDALMRVAAVRAAEGYDPSLIAGEEPDLCLRMKRLGWKVLRIDAEMTIHDAAMTRFGQWWRRTLRAGHAYAEGAARHGRGPERYYVKEVRSNWLWGLALPTVALGLAPPTGGLSLGFLGLYGVLGARIYHRTKQRPDISPDDGRLYAVFCVLGKVPQALGQALYWSRRITGGRARLIEYKSGPVGAPSSAGQIG